MPKRISPRPLPSRYTFKRVDSATAKQLLDQYGGLVRTIAKDWASRACGCELDDLVSVGQIAVIEGYVTCRECSKDAWIKRVVRWRIKEEATRFVELPCPCATTPAQIADPEELYATAFAREAIGRLDPRRGVLLQTRLQGYTCVEVGEQLGVSPQRTNKLEHEAYEQLRQWYDE